MPTYCIQDSRKVKGTTINDLVLFAESIDLTLRHSAKLSKKFRVNLPLDLMDEMTKVFVGRYSDPLVVVLK
jgi:NRPS condensation-like uncharacterized protein